MSGIVVPRPSTPGPVADGIYLGRVLAVERALSRYGRDQVALRLRLNTREETRVWVNLTARGLDMLIRAGIADDTPEGVRIHDSGLVGVLVQSGRGTLIPASKAAQLNPSLQPLYEQARLLLRGA